MTQVQEEVVAKKRNRFVAFMRDGHWFVGICTFLAGILTLVGAISAALIDKYGWPAYEALISPQGGEASQVLELPGPIDPLPAKDNRTNFFGKLKSPLPDGRHIYLATQGPITADTPPRLATGKLTFAPACTVDEEALTFSCGDVQLGLEEEGGTFKIYVGLADSAAASAIGDYLFAQGSKAAIGESHTDVAPAGFDVVGDGLTVHRDGPRVSGG